MKCLLILALFLVQYSLSACPDGFQLVNGKCLLVFPNNLKHLEAEQDCSYFGGTLVNVKNAIDNRAISTFANSTGPVNSIWLGIFCFSTENSTTTCYHDDNSGVVDFNQFAPGNPTVTGNGGCVYMQVSGKSVGQWYSAPCDVIGMPFVCEVPVTENDPDCVHNFAGYCYMGSHEMHLATVNTTYTAAQSICQSRNGNLVSFHSKPEIDFVRSIYRDSDFQRIVIGAKALLPGTFKWSDGSFWDYDYTDPLATSTGNCMVMDLSKRDNNGMWSQVDCQSSNYFLCKRKISGGDTVATTVDTPKEGKMEKINPKFSGVKESVKTELLDFSNCNSTLIMSPGIITSYGYPNANPPKKYCTWNLATLGPYRIGIYFTDFSVYFPLNIYDANDNLIKSPGYTQQPFEVLAPGNLVKITHDSSADAQFNYHGFTAKILPF